MTVLLVRTLERPARACFEAFCDVETTPDWVEPIRSVAVRRRYPEGRPEIVDFTTLTNTGAEIEYALVYAYEPEQLRVTWRAESSTTDGVRGLATFVDDDRTGTCTMTYVLNYGSDWHGDFVSEHARAEKVLDAFAARVQR